MYGTLAASVVLCTALSGASTSITSAPVAIASTSTSSPASNATCPYRTVNYITHGLPQQCLTSTWRNHPSLPSSNGTDGALTESGYSAYAANTSVASEDGTSNPTTPTDHDIEPATTVASDQFESASDSTATALTLASAHTSGSDDPSPLEDEKFMSFEEWKRQNLQKAGQSEHVGSGARLDAPVPRKRPTNIHTALDSLGDDAEIDLDFSGFMPSGPDLSNDDTPLVADDHEPVIVPQSSASPGPGSRSKDAGTTCKERYNYASFDCAASVRKANPEAMSMTAVLGENKDSYMLNVCSAENKFLILELCNDISIDTIVLANFEFFSSIFRTFRVSVSDKYPVKADKWKTLGTFEARNTREIQAFLIENSVIWARYLRIEFLTHYGSEYYCPISLVRVHGTTMLEEYKHDLESLQPEDDSSEEGGEAIAAVGETLVPEAVADVIANEKDKEAQATAQEIIAEHSASNNLGEWSEVQSSTPTELGARSDTSKSLTQERQVPSTSLLSFSSSPTEQVKVPGAHDVSHTTETDHDSGVETLDSRSQVSSQIDSSLAHSSATPNTTVVEVDELRKTSVIPTSTITVEYENATMPSDTAYQAYVNATASHNQTAGNSTMSEKMKGSTTGSAVNAVPTMQESFFKSVQKRLQMLEANSSLSLQYIEDQSRALRDAFNKVEQRQLAKTTTFLDYLNTTVLSELRDFRQQYDQLWQSTVIELETQRERYQQDTAAMNARLGVLADELIFQKRLFILQMTLILICLGLVLFTKGHFNQYLEMPAVQRVLSRPPSSRWLSLASLDTPTQSPPPTREGSLVKRHGILKGHKRMQSEDSIEASLSPQEIYSPPTPVSIGDVSDGEPIKTEHRLDDPEFDPSTIQRPSTSPPILPSSTDPSTPELGAIAGPGQEVDSIDKRLLDSPLDRDSVVPRVVVEDATTPTKHLKWSLPNS